MKFMNIPSQFKIFDQVINIEFNDKLLETKSILGQAFVHNNLIELQSPNSDVCVEIVEQTFWHEVVHFVLWKAGYSNLFMNEKLVDIVGSILHQVHTSINENLQK